jgi:membrane-associated protease RseP (regulator of RpoE activity)
MDQPFLFPNLAGEPSNANQATGNPASANLETEGYRTTVVHRLPQYFSPSIPQTIPAEPKEITFGRLLFHLLLLGLTVVTTTVFIGIFWLGGLMEGIVYSFTVLSILMAHEMGHYIACRWYGVRATLPYFIPAPIWPVGTFGAFIKIKSPIPSRRALFDIGIAGPLAGFVFAIPAALIAHYFAEPAAPADMSDGSIIINSPLLFKFFEHLFHLQPNNLFLVPPGSQMNPIWWAAWIGVFMTSLNLLPVGQLDGGHVTYAALGRRGHRAVALASYVCVIALALYSVRDGLWNWVVYAVLLTLVMRVGHPPVVDEDEPLGLARKLVAIIGLLVFVLSFMPFPITF